MNIDFSSKDSQFSHKNEKDTAKILFKFGTKTIINLLHSENSLVSILSFCMKKRRTNIFTIFIRNQFLLSSEHQISISPNVFTYEYYKKNNKIKYIYFWHPIIDGTINVINLHNQCFALYFYQKSLLLEVSTLFTHTRFFIQELLLIKTKAMNVEELE